MRDVRQKDGQPSSHYFRPLWLHCQGAVCRRDERAGGHGVLLFVLIFRSQIFLDSRL